jgi:hypothetical protein
VRSYNRYGDGKNNDAIAKLMGAFCPISRKEVEVFGEDYARETSASSGCQPLSFAKIPVRSRISALGDGVLCPRLNARDRLFLGVAVKSLWAGWSDGLLIVRPKPSCTVVVPRVSDEIRVNR